MITAAKVAIGVTVILIVLIILVLLLIYIVVTRFVSAYDWSIVQYCDLMPTITYGQAVTYPVQNGVYQYTLAKALVDISIGVSQSYCQNLDPLPMPPGFDHQIPIMSTDARGKNERMFCIIFIDSTARRFLVAFAGTIYLDQWVTDFTYPLVEAVALNNYVSGIQCHKGFYNAYVKVQERIWEAWNKYKPAETYITGHSLGGALSTICAFDFALATPGIVHYSFAAPRSGNIQYAAKFNAMVPQSVRVANIEDEIPHLPPAVFFGGNVYNHTTGLISFDQNFGSIGDNHITAYVSYMPVQVQ